MSCGEEWLGTTTRMLARNVPKHARTCEDRVCADGHRFIGNPCSGGRGGCSLLARLQMTGGEGGEEGEEGEEGEAQGGGRGGREHPLCRTLHHARALCSRFHWANVGRLRGLGEYRSNTVAANPAVPSEPQLDNSFAGWGRADPGRCAGVRADAQEGQEGEEGEEGGCG
jgi:hypothetical protein